MSDQNYLQQQTQNQLRQYPDTQKLQPGQGNYFDRQTINNEIHRIQTERTQQAWDPNKK